MCRRLVYFSYVLLFLVLATGVPASARVPIEVENYSFEIPDDNRKHDIDVGTPGVVTGWARVDPTTSAGRELGWTPTTGTYTGFMGKDAVIFNLTDFLLMEGDQFQMIYDARSTWQGSNLLAQLYYDDEGERIVFASTSVDLSEQAAYATFTVDSNAVGPEVNDHKIGIQFKHEYVEGLWPDDNIWCGIDYIELFVTSPLIRAQNPYPEHESSYEDVSVDLTWIPGPNAPSVDSYQIYFSNDWADVNEGAPAADKGTSNAESYSISELTRGETYYWRIDTIIGADVYRGNIWKFNVTSTNAYKPDPAVGAEYVSVEPVLDWEAGTGSVEGHVVFLGDNFDDVYNAPSDISGSPPFRAYITNPADTNWAPSEAGLDLLETSTTYYWRIDEVESTESMTIHKGEVWSFTTVPFKGLGSITRQLYEGTSGNTIDDLLDDPNYPDNPSSTGYLTSFEAPHMAISQYGSRVYGWLYVRNAGEYTFWIASGENSQLWFGDHPSTASIIAFVDGEEGREGWTQPREWDKYPEVQQSDPMYLQGDGSLYYIMALQKKNWGYDNLSVAWSGPDSNNVQQIIPGTSLIPFEQVTLVKASGPNPRSGATDVYRDIILSWTSGEYAAKHEVYLGTDEEAIANATIDSPEYKVTNDRGSEIFNPGQLELNTTYYWRVDEVNETNPEGPWLGKVWSFTVGNFLVVDDFESYNDITPGEEGSNRVYLTWTDGFDNPSANGSTIGYPNPSFADGEHFVETDIVHGGDQSTPIFYDNTTANISDVTVNPENLAIGRDWASEGPERLSLWVYGDPNNATSEQMYVEVNGTRVNCDVDLALAEWQEISIDLASLGIDLSNVTVLAIVFERTGATGGAGVVFIDDIRLYLP
jgi:hypothetical protein